MNSPQSASPWFPYENPAPEARLQVLTFPFAGGGASRFLALSRPLAPEIGTLAVQFPGRENRIAEPAYGDATALGTALAETCGPLLPERYALLGYSIGACYALAFARAAELIGLRPPEALIAVAAPAPHLRSRLGLWKETDKALLEEMQRWQTLPEEILDSPELIDHILKIVRADLRTWESGPADATVKVDCPVFVYAGLDDLTVTEAQLDGWRERTTGRVVKRYFPGGHFFGFDDPELLADALSEDLRAFGSNALPREALHGRTARPERRAIGVDNG
jgi:surfactin synthase thioesterase subunit